MASEPFDAVLAEMREQASAMLYVGPHKIIAELGRLAADHAAEVGEWKRVAAAQAELHDESERRAEAAERDARRYRWLRGKLSISALRSGFSGLVNGRDYRTDFDAFVDAAIATTEQAAGE